MFSHIYLPMARGGLATVVLLTFIQEIANINTGLRMLQDEGQAFAFGTLSAVILLAMIPPWWSSCFCSVTTCAGSVRELSPVSREAHDEPGQHGETTEGGEGEEHPPRRLR